MLEEFRSPSKYTKQAIMHRPFMLFCSIFAPCSLRWESPMILRIRHVFRVINQRPSLRPVVCVLFLFARSFVSPLAESHS